MTLRSLISVSLALALVLGGCKADRMPSEGLGLPDSPEAISKGNRVIYQVNVWAYSPTHNFKGLEDDLQRLKDLGVDILWLMPIHPRGEINSGGSLGSPYAVKDYKGIYPAYGTEEDFRSLVSAAHSLGMEIWLDWVANHSAWDNPWVSEHLEFYAEKDGRRPYSPPGWDDAVQFDHSCPGLLDAMADAMIYWVRDFGVDGFRCDAADRVPVAFWSALRERVDAVKNVMWLSEGEDPDHMAAFDYDYAWAFADELMSFGQTGDVAALKRACASLHKDRNYSAKGRMTYITNHDLNAFNQSEFRRYPGNVMPLTVLSYTVFDLPLIYNGQEIGMDKSMSFSDDVTVDWSVVNKRFVELHRKLCLLKHSQPALSDAAERGGIRFYETRDNNLLVFSRIKGGNEVLVALNLGEYAIQCRFTGDAPSGWYFNWLSEEVVKLDASGFPLEEHGYAIFVK